MHVNDAAHDAQSDAVSDSSAETGAEAGPSQAGQHCMTDTDCNDPSGTITCDTSAGFAAGICTNTGCTQSTSSSAEQMQCGGAGSTCLTIGDPGDPQPPFSLCTHACRPATATTSNTGCQSDEVCTGWWYTHANGTPDLPGCFQFCHQDSDCMSGMHCNTYTGECGATAADMTKAVDGENCDLAHDGMNGHPPSDCRGVCFSVSNSDMTHGVCGSFLDTHVGQACPDDPNMLIQPLAPSGDNLATCIWRSCSCDADCMAPQQCVQNMGAGVCTIPDTSAMPPETGTACDGGTNDGGDAGGVGDAAPDA
jgi:hypothetical protein